MTTQLLAEVPPEEFLEVTRDRDLDRLHLAALRQLRWRLALAKPLSRSQIVAASLLSEGYQPLEIAAIMGVSVRTIRYHIRAGADKIPGDRSSVERMIAWWRGADVMILTGKAAFTPLSSGQDGYVEPSDPSLRAGMTLRSAQQPKRHASREVAHARK